MCFVVVILLRLGTSASYISTVAGVSSHCGTATEGISRPKTRINILRKQDIYEAESRKNQVDILQEKVLRVSLQPLHYTQLMIR